MGFYRALIQANPHSMSGGFYSSSWQTAKEEHYGYLINIKFTSATTSLNISNLIPNILDLSDPNHPDFPVFGTGNSLRTVTGINISSYDKIYLNSDCSNMFNGCRNCTDWSGLTLLDWTYVTNCCTMFRNCVNFNQPVTLGNNVVDCTYMFYNCVNFNQPVTLGNNVNNCNQMFRSCQKFNQPVTIPISVGSINQMFPYCNSFNSDIYVKGNQNRRLTCAHMFLNVTNVTRKNIWFNNVFNNVFNQTYNGWSITGTSVSWTQMADGNGFYNEGYNIYCYNNYEG